MSQPPQWVPIMIAADKSLYQTAFDESVKVLDALKSDFVNNPAVANQNILRALIYVARFATMLSSHDIVKAIEVFEKEIDEHTTIAQNNHLETTPSLATMHSLVGELYSSYLSNNGYSLRGRTQVAAGDANNKDRARAAGFGATIVESMKTWAPQDIEEVAFAHYAASVEYPAELIKHPLEAYGEILSSIGPDATLRPTLFDLLGHRALNYLGKSSNFLTEPSNKFVLTDLNALTPDADTFAKIVFESPDQTSRSLRGLLIYQHLTAVHHPRNHNNVITPAYAETQLSRGKFVYGLLGGSRDAKDAAFDVFLNNLAVELEGVETISSVLNELASREQNARNRDNGSLQRAVELYTKASTTFPDSTGAIHAANSVQTILKPSIEVTHEGTVAPGKPSLAGISFANVNAVRAAVFKGPFTENNSHNTKERVKTVLEEGHRVGDVQILDLPDVGDYRKHNSEFAVPEQSTPGDYALVVWTSKLRGDTRDSGREVPDLDADFVSCQRYKVSTMLTITAHNAAQTADTPLTVVVVDRITGDPLPMIKVNFYTPVYNNAAKKTDRTEVVTVLTDANGFASPPPGLDRSYSYWLVRGTEELDESNSVYSYKSTLNNRIRRDMVVFTDRNIYRPGQEVFFKAIVIEKDTEGIPRIIPNHRTTMSLYDTNGRPVGTPLEVVSNEYGSVDGVLTLPTTGNTGDFSIHAGDVTGQANFKVEEYKRPKFDVKLSTKAQEVRLGDEVIVEGIAKNLNGIPLGGAAVKYHVQRTASVPWFWFLSCRGRRCGSPWWGSAKAEVFSGTATTKDDGTFQMQFQAVGDMAIPPEDKPEFSFQVTADVADITGESHRATVRTVAGTVALKSNFNFGATTSIEELKAKHISLTDLNGNALDAQAEVTFTKVIAPHPAGEPFLTRQHRTPDTWIIPQIEHKAKFPLYAYGDEASKDKWPKDQAAAVLKRTVLSKKDNGTGNGSDLHQGALEHLAYYEVRFTATDAFGMAVEVSATTQVYDTSNPTYLVDTIQDVSGLVKFSKSSYSVGDSASATIHIRRGVKRVLAILSTPSQPGRFHWIAADTTRPLEAVLRDGDQGTVQVQLVYVLGNKMRAVAGSAQVEWTEKQLRVQLTTFRDHLEPGQDEEWRFKITGNQKDAIVNAEVLATLYDESLDSLAGFPHYLDGGSLFPHRRVFASFDAPQSRSRCDNIIQRKEQFRSIPTIRHATIEWGFSFLPPPVRRFYKGSRCRAPMTNAEPLSAPLAASAAAPKRMMAMRHAAPAIEGGGEKESLADSSDEMDNDPFLEARGGVDAGGDGDGGEEEPKVRTNLKETVFFFPKLTTDSNGDVTMAFTMGEALTKWKLLAFAHTPTLQHGTFSRGGIVTTKQLMVVPNPPRFFREGDVAHFAAKVAYKGLGGGTESPISGNVRLEVFDAITMAPLSTLYELEPSSGTAFTIPVGKSEGMSWRLKVPVGGPSAVTWRIVADAGRVSDGEQATVPVSTNRMLVTETMAMNVRGSQTKVFDFKAMNKAASPSLAHHALTVEFTSNPAWYAVQALPYLMEFPHQCSEQIFSRFYSNSLAQHVTAKLPKIQRVFEAWRTLKSDATNSNLNKNEELKGALIEETPWVMEAQSEAEQKKRIALLFDLNTMGSGMGRAIDELISRQRPDGGFAWFPGSRSADRFTTQHIALGIAHLLHLGLEVNQRTLALQQAAQDYCYRELVEDYERHVNTHKLKMSDFYPSSIHLLFLYAESFKTLHPTLSSPSSDRDEPLLEFILQQGLKEWSKSSLFGQALLAMITHRRGNASVSQGIVASLKERATKSDELGMYWSMARGHFFDQLPIETHALMIEVFSEVAADKDAVAELRLWLLKNKQTKNWKTTTGTAAAVYALLLGGESWLDESELVGIKVGGTAMPMVNAEPGTGYVKHRYEASDITPQHSIVEVVNPNKGVAWGAAYWQYFEDLNRIESFEDTPLKLRRSFFIVRRNERGEQLVAAHVLRSTATCEDPEDVSVAVIGDRIRVRTEVRVDRPMDYVHLKDMHPAGLEPTNVLSGYHYQDATHYYQSTRDTATHFFFSSLNPGTFVLEYDLMANQKGIFSSGISTIQCMYAPEFSSHAEGLLLDIV